MDKESGPAERSGMQFVAANGLTFLPTGPIFEHEREEAEKERRLIISMKCCVNAA